MMSENGPKNGKIDDFVFHIFNLIFLRSAGPGDVVRGWDEWRHQS